MTEVNGYKKVHLGPQVVEIPKTWQITRIQSIANFKSGYAFKSSDYTNEGIFILRSINISESGRIDREKDAKFVPREFLTKYNQFKMKENDIVVVMVGASSGKLGLVQRGALPALLNQNMWRIRPSSEKAKKRFLYYLLEKNMNRFLSQKVGSARSYLKKKDFKKFSIAKPPIPEQKKIAEVLSTGDEAIQKTDQIIERTKELKKGLMQDLLTKGIAHEEFKEVQLGPKKIQIPLEWQVKRIDEIFDVKAGGDVDKNIYSETKDEDHPYPIYANSLENKGLYGYSSDYTYPEGCITITGRGSLGKAIYRRNMFNAIVRLIVLIPKVEIGGPFISEYINEKVNFWEESTGVPQLTRPQVKRSRICFPPLPEQKKIAKILSTVDEKIQKEKAYKEELENLKKGLMQDLLTGKVRVLPLLTEEEKEQIAKENVTG